MKKNEYTEGYQKVVFCENCGSPILSVSIGKEMDNFSNLVRLEFLIRCGSCEDPQIYIEYVEKEF